MSGVEWLPTYLPMPASFPWLPEINKEGERERSIRGGLVCQRLRREGGIRLALTLALSTRWRVVTLVWLTCSAKEAAGAEGFLEWGV